MDWLQKLVADSTEEFCPKCGQKKLVQSKTDRWIAEDFRVMCAEIGRTEKDVIQEVILNILEQYNTAKQ